MTHTFELMSICLGVLLLAGCSSTERMYHNDPPLEFADFAYPFATQTADVNGVSLAFHDAGGTGTPVVLIHGLASNMGFWRYNIPALTKAGYRVIAVDLPGYGKSGKAFGAPYSLSFYAETVTGLLRHLGIPRAVFAGHSMGGQISMIAALHAPDVVAKLVLLSPAGFEPFKEGEGTWLRNAVTPSFIKNTTEAGVRANLSGNFYSWNDEWEWMVEERMRMSKAQEFDRFAYAVWKSVGAMLDEPVWSKLGKISQSTLVIAGENDNLIPNPYLHGGRTADVMQWGIAQLPHARLVMLPSTGHMVQMERNDEVNSLIIGFCK